MGNICWVGFSSYETKIAWRNSQKTWNDALDFLKFREGAAFAISHSHFSPYLDIVQTLLVNLGENKQTSKHRERERETDLLFAVLAFWSLWSYFQSIITCWWREKGVEGVGVCFVACLLSFLVVYVFFSFFISYSLLFLTCHSASSYFFSQSS